MLEPLTVINDDFIPGKTYYVDKYDELCEEHFKIKKIVPLKISTWKFVLDIILSLTLVKFYIYGFSDRLVKIMKYEECTLDEAEILGIYCCDGYFYFEELKKIKLPNVKNPDILTSQLNYSRDCFLFTFKLFSYIFNPSTNGFNSIKFSIYRKKNEIFEYMSKGLTKDERKYQELIYGECDLNFKINSFFRELFLTTCRFFFVFQVYSITLWIITKYYAYSTAIALMTIYDLLEESITTIKNLKNIREMARYSVNVKIYEKKNSKNFDISEKSSLNLVPGDIFELPEDGQAMPCDCILLSGSVIINEAMLTGESTPIIKSHLPNIKNIFDEEKDLKYFLFAGTKIVQKRKENKQPVIALCYSTGFNSIKGNLIRSILYPVKTESKFEKESVKFIFFMACLCVLGFLIVLPFKIVRANEKEDPSDAYFTIIKQGLDLITTAVPPTLPCCLGIAIGIAQSRFKKKQIMCINRNKITPAGKVNICVFDKTGTLTEDHLNIAGFVPIEVHSKQKDEKDQKDQKENNSNNISNNIFTFDHFYKSIKKLSNENLEYYKLKAKDATKKSKVKELKQLFIECLACCQGITRVNGKIIGDPIDVEMFESTGWDLIEDPEDQKNYDPRITTYVRPNQEKSLTEKLKDNDNNGNNINFEEINDQMIDHYELGIIRRFDFSSKLQRMSVIAKNLIESNYICYCKGSPEKLKELCMPETIPQNFNDELNNYTTKGYRVLALASKAIQMDFSESLEISRNYCEKDLIFLGLLVVENKLKKVTSKILKVLSEKANLKVRMATGDNIMTAICVGRKSNLIDPEGIVYSCDIEKEENDNLNNINTNINTNNENLNNIDNIDNIGNNDNYDGNLNINNIINSNIYDNSLLKRREKEKIKKKLVWKTIENFNDNIEENDNNLMKSNKKNENVQKKTSFFSNSSFLLPKEVDENEFREDNNIDFFLKAKNEENPAKKEDNTEKKEENEFDENIEIDFSSLPFDRNKMDANIQIAITGKTFETLYRMNQKYENSVKKIKKVNSPYTINKDDNYYSINESNNEININNDEENENLDVDKILNYKQFHEAFRLVLSYCSIYARCSPENKTQLVESLQKESFTVLMCGDGANDCGALKVADVGISLSTEEASIAAPFTSSIPDISCVIEVLKEGKCALVTSFQIFKYIILYSLIQFISVTFLIFIDSYLSDWQFMVQDLFLITPLAFLMPLTPAYDTLTYHRPVSSLLSFSIIFSMFLQTLNVAGFQLLIYFLVDLVFPKKDDNFHRIFCGEMECELDNFRKCTDFDFEDDEEESNCIDNSAIFYISFAQLLILCVVFAKGKPFKKTIFHNIWLFAFCILMFIYSEYIVFYVDKFSNKLIKIVAFPDDSFTYNPSTEPKYNMQFKFYVMIIIILNFIFALFIEKVIVAKVTKCWNTMRMKSLKLKIENDKKNEANLNLITSVQNYVKEQKNEDIYD